MRTRFNEIFPTPYCLLSAILAGILVAGVVAAQGVRAPQRPDPAPGPQTAISTGREGGSYHGIGQRLQARMLADHGYGIAVESSSGSIQNLARLADPSSPVGLALTQSDALAQFLKMNAEFAGEYLVLGDAGRECVFLIASQRGGIRSFAELEAAVDGQVSVDDPGSGAAVTFEYLMGMDPALSDLQLAFTDTMETLLQLKVGGEHTDLRAAMIVQRPSTRSPAVGIVLANPRDYRFVPIREADVQNAHLPDQSVVYSFERVRVGGSEAKDGLEVETLCTRSLLLASKAKLSREVRSRLSLLMLEAGAVVIGQDD
jgi:TRAP-type uncharacterized transport system substrate-binding protein